MTSISLGIFLEFKAYFTAKADNRGLKHHVDISITDRDIALSRYEKE
uniref:Uncharacterized protein n=1 Tax=Utricularia reniformis TaxID=192314 RepID=A0A1Y0B4X2_9LAMI|nr:hypothetical protein AEK19_MT2254 [Utricularia reniformis]ART32399.1 hypothetical protein AEK19_MT2254 [Utricularia reniformis]